MRQPLSNHLYNDALQYAQMHRYKLALQFRQNQVRSDLTKYR